ncbi:MAG TPA: glycoside hydrolase family 2 TIM barrel-domain containing protein [Pseudonocardia sp.]
MKASELGGNHPRPQLVRPGWTTLDGPWRFAHDDKGRGLVDRWYDPAVTEPFAREIRVPFPPESTASGVGDTDLHPVVWYRRTVTEADLGAVPDRLALVRFGAVDHAARVWFDGVPVGEHVGGQTPFAVDVTALLADDPQREHVLVVRAEDDPHDLAQPRGKQDWRREPHDVWYHRTTGIWQSVWAEAVPPQHVVDLAWITDAPGGTVRAELTLAARPVEPVSVTVELTLADEVLAEVTARVDGPRAVVDLALPAFVNGQDRGWLVWTPEDPTLIDARVVVRAGGAVLDEVHSYLGLRTAGVGGGSFLLNGRPYYVRSVLGQGYWPDTHLAATPDALRREVELIKELGFNAVRVHQKVEDPRFLYWADRLGLLVWGETAAAYEFSVHAVELLTREWLDVVRRDRSHPSIVTWVPLNESWGVQDIALDPAQQAYAAGLAALTRALDPTRPVISNDGWEHVDSDILGVHDYTTDPDALHAHYRDGPAIQDTVAGLGPQGRRPVLTEAQLARFAAGTAPLMITEFGGVAYANDAETWGYAEVASDEEFGALLRALFEALRSCPDVVGFCYTQLTDTLQEANGLLTADRRPKLPVEVLREIVTGAADPAAVASTNGRAPAAEAKTETP